MEITLNNLVHDVSIKTGFCKSGKKELLHGIDASFRSGQLVALMGASGAGKTTLLSVLRAGRNPGMTLNGHRMPGKFAKLCCTIPQADILYPALTPEQSVLYSARLRLSEKLSQAELVEKVRALLDELRLTKCKDSPIGNEDRRGISGGERKRTSIAMELIANPSVLLVDEPTSGLDSKSAEDVIRLLRDVARRGKIVISTIHQPSWSMFEHFDKLLLLHHGLVVYHGTTGKKMRDFFQSHMGLTPPAFENPLDFYMREIQTREGPFFTDKWKEASEEDKIALDMETAEKWDQELSVQTIKQIQSQNSKLFQFKTLLQRNVHDNLIDKEKFLQGLGMKLGVGIMLGIVFIGQARPAEGSDTTSTSSIFTTTSPLFFIVLSAVIDTLFHNIIKFPQVRAIVVREYRNSAFSLGPYLCAEILSNTCFDIFASLFYMPAYFMVGLGPTAEQVFLFIAALALLTAIGTGIGLALGSISKDINEAQNYMMPVLLPLLIFSGFLLPLANIPDVFVWLYYVSPFQWALSSLLIIEFEPRKFFDGPPFTGAQYLASQDLYYRDLGRNFAILGGSVALCFIFSFFIIRRAISKKAQGA